MDGPGWDIGILQSSIATLLSRTLSVWQVKVGLKVCILILPKRNATFTNCFLQWISSCNLCLRQAPWATWWSMCRKVEMLFGCPDLSLSWEPGHSWSDTLLTTNVRMLENPISGPLWRLSRKGQCTAGSLPSALARFLSSGLSFDPRYQCYPPYFF